VEERPPEKRVGPFPLGRGVFGFMAGVGEVQCLQVFLSQRPNMPLTLFVPAVAFNAADQPLAVVVDLDQRPAALRTDFGFVIQCSHFLKA
jgi:hypothetical protein